MNRTPPGISRRRMRLRWGDWRATQAVYRSAPADAPTSQSRGRWHEVGATPLERWNPTRDPRPFQAFTRM